MLTDIQVLHIATPRCLVAGSCYVPGKYGYAVENVPEVV